MTTETSTTLSRTAAVRRARQCVDIAKEGDDWRVYRPWDIDDLDGPNTADSRTYSHASAQSRAAELIHQIALHLMGWSREDAYCEANSAGPGRVEDRVRRSVEQRAA